MLFPFFLVLPDPFARVSVDGSGQLHSTEVRSQSLNPKWNTHFDLYLNPGDAITITVWNQKKALKKQGSGFLGCTKIMSSMIQRLKDTGCKTTVNQYNFVLILEDRRLEIFN